MLVIIRKTGTRGQVLKSVGDDYYVKLSDGRQLWYAKDALIFIE